MQKNKKAAPPKAPPPKLPAARVVNVEEFVDEEEEEEEDMEMDVELDEEETEEMASVDNEELVSKDEEEDMEALLGMSVQNYNSLPFSSSHDKCIFLFSVLVSSQWLTIKV